jgi:hypothetical protein
MASLVSHALRLAYRREVLPPRARWLLAAAGMRDFFRVVSGELAAPLGDARHEVVGALARELFRRRWRVLRQTYPHLPAPEEEPRAIALFMSGLYLAWAAPKAARIFSGVGGPARGLREHLGSRRLLAPLDAAARWEETTVHLGELLIVMTERLSAELPGARKLLSDMCFRMGARYAERARHFFGMDGPERGRTAPGDAIEILRMSEYVFRVNPEHWSHVDAEAGVGWLEGNACPWFERPGWHAGHCGIFGQFQAGIASEFGLTYRLTQTIPKHGGSTCRIDLVPLRSRSRPRESHTS